MQNHLFVGNSVHCKHWGEEVQTGNTEFEFSMASECGYPREEHPVIVEDIDLRDGMVLIPIDKVQRHDYLTIEKIVPGQKIPSRITSVVTRIAPRVQHGGRYVEFEDIAYGYHFDGEFTWKSVRALRDLDFKITDKNEIERGDVVCVTKPTPTGSEKYMVNVASIDYIDSSVQEIRDKVSGLVYDISGAGGWNIAYIERPSWKDI